MEKRFLRIFYYILIISFICPKPSIKSAVIKASWEEKENFYYLYLTSEENLKEGTVVFGVDNKKQLFYIEIVGVVGTNYYLFQQVELIWDDKNRKINTSYFSKPNLSNPLRIDEIYGNFNLLLINKIKEVELNYNKAEQSFGKKRFHLAEKYFKNCLNMISKYKDVEDRRKEIINIIAIYRTQIENAKIDFGVEMNQVKQLKSEGDFNKALAILRKLIMGSPLDTGIRYQLSKLYDEMGYIYRNDEYFQDAVDEIEELLFIEPENNKAMRDFAFLYFYQGDKDKAIETLQEAVSRANVDSATELKDDIDKIIFVSSDQSDVKTKTVCNICLKPISGETVRFPNDLVICGECNESQVRDKQDLKSYFQAIESLFETKYRMKIKAVKDFVPVSEIEMEKIANVRDKKNIPLVYFRTLYTDYEVNYLNSLPRVLVIEELASGYAGAWLREQNLSCINVQTEEGFKMFFKYVMLNHFRCEEQAKRFSYRNDPISFNFRRIKVIVENKGEAKLNEEVKKCFE